MHRLGNLHKQNESSTFGVEEEKELNHEDENDENQAT